jgi:hypothetical protein
VHVKRGANGAAHGLAKIATREQIEKIWMEEILSNIYNILTIEQFALYV